MQRLLIGAIGAAFLAASAAPALADDYPVCTSPGQDHCRVMPHRGSYKRLDHHGHHHHHGPSKPKKP